jgi:hypothetical protein
LDARVRHFFDGPFSMVPLLLTIMYILGEHFRMVFEEVDSIVEPAGALQIQVNITAMRASHINEIAAFQLEIDLPSGQL